VNHDLRISPVVKCDSIGQPSQGPPLLSENNLPAVQHSCYSKYIDLRPHQD
jgi:hypothetical protein